MDAVGDGNSEKIRPWEVACLSSEKFVSYFSDPRAAQAFQEWRKTRDLSQVTRSEFGELKLTQPFVAEVWGGKVRYADW
jgi:hypothetical protein